MHILLVHQIFVTPEEGGGTRHYELARYLVDKGHRVTVVASDTDYLTGKKKGKKKETREGIEIIYASTFRAVHKSFFQRAISFLCFAASSFFNALKVQNVDLIWATSPPLFQAVTTLLIAKLMRKPLIFEVRDLWIDFAEELGIVKNRVVIRIIKYIERLLYRSSDRIIVNSPGFIPFISRYVDPAKINLIPNGVLTSDFDVAGLPQSDFRSRYSLENKFVAIYLGNLGVANDIETIIEAADHLRDNGDIVFVLMGGGIRQQEIKMQVSERRLQNVLVLDTRPKSEIPLILAQVDVCIATLKDIPLFRTTYPNKVFDYMAAERPTVLAIDGVIREVIESSEGGIYVAPGDDNELSEAVLRYYRNPELKRLHGKNAKKYVKRNFERETIADGLENILLDLNKNIGIEMGKSD